MRTLVIARPGIDLALLAVVAIAAGAGVAALGSADVLAVVVVVGLTAVQWTCLRRVSGQPLPLPAVTVVTFNVVGLLGWLYYPDIADRAAVSASLPETEAVYSNAAAVFIAASACVFAGGLIGSRVKSGAPLAPGAVVAEVRTLVAQPPAGGLVAASAVPLLVAVVARTPAGLIERPHYLDAYGPAALVRTGGMLTPVGLALAAMLLTSRGPRLMPGVILAGYFVLIFALGSRQLATLPVMVYLAWLINRPEASGTRRLAAGAATAGVALIFLQLPLTLRAMAHGAGLVPYLRLLAEDPGLLLSINLPSITGNILFAVPLAGVAAQQSIPLEWLSTSLSPLPGPLTAWNEIRGNLRLNVYTPYSGLGELRAHGWAWLTGVTLAMGALLGALQQWNSRLSPRAAALAAVVGLGLTAAPTLSLLQYNLRSGVRSLWYFALLSVALHLVARRAGATSSPSRASGPSCSLPTRWSP